MERAFLKLFADHDRRKGVVKSRPFFFNFLIRNSNPAVYIINHPT